MNEIPLTHALVADDEPHIGRIIKMKLEQGPFRVTLVYDGREALEVLRREDDIRLVLLDLMMPYLSGLDVLAEMKRDERLKHVPTIVLTAAGQEQQHHLRAGARRERVHDEAVQPEAPLRARGRAGRPRARRVQPPRAHDAVGRRPRRRRRIALLAGQHP